MIDLVREYWDWFLLDTLMWTGGLIALVLILRRPVARHLGPGAAYALWALPALRLLLPPITLPAWMEPVPAMPADSAAPPLPVADLDPGFMAMASMPAPTLPEPTDFVTPLAIMWLVGAVFFLARRFWLYGELRSELLEDAVPVGESGNVRLVETPAISGPMAFGVIDKVIALPSGFMTSRDRQSRDLAIAHELEHHRGHDLLANILVQPLFAAHWFNPLGWMGWTALRRDQEAWCDARVVASRPQEERAVYAGVIADFARRPQVAPRPALAAPMACPVLGDKSIIHRLRNLSMNDVSRRRRFTGRAGIAAALFALPMTATVCYSAAAASDMPLPPAAPEAPAAPLAPQAPDAPLPPAAPEAPESEAWPDADRFEEEMAEVERDLDKAERDMAKAEREFDRAEKEFVELERDIASGDRKRISKHKISWNGKDWDEMTPAERKKMKKEMAEVRAKFAEGGEFRGEMAKARRDFPKAEEIRREMRIAFAESRKAEAEAHAASKQIEVAKLSAESHPNVVMECRGEDAPVATQVDSDGRTTLYVCETYGEKIALKTLKMTRKMLAKDLDIPAADRAEALREIDVEIRRLSR